MDINLTSIEARVLGALIEKEITAPGHYPLSLRALTSACNQKSNRNPLMSLNETQALEALDGLIKRRLVRKKTPPGSRVTKYAHRLSNTLGLTYDFSQNELGVLCVLMLRGAQTVDEIHVRSARVGNFNSLTEVEHTLGGLVESKFGRFVMKLPNQPGNKESRYAHLLCGEISVGDNRDAEPAESR